MKILFEPTPGIVNSADLEYKPNKTEIFSVNPDFLKKRSRDYITLLSSLDHNLVESTQGWSELMAKIQQEFGTAELQSLPLGLISKCYLGYPYEVHTLDLSGSQILRHFKIHEKMPDLFEKARSLARNPFYDLVEVYSDKILAVRADGTVIKL